MEVRTLGPGCTDVLQDKGVCLYKAMNATSQATYSNCMYIHHYAIMEQ